MANHIFTGVFIPAKIWIAKDLIPQEKMMLAEIKALSEDSGWCFAANKHFAEWLGCGTSNISNYIQRFQREGMIEVTYTDKKTFSGRRMRVNLEWFHGLATPYTDTEAPYTANVPPFSGNEAPYTGAVTERQFKSTSKQNFKDKADKPQPAQPNETNPDQNLNENPKKPNNFTGGGAAKKEKTAPKIHAENEPHFAYFSDPAKAKAAWTEWIEYKHTQHRQKYKEAKSELTKLRQLFQQFNGDSAKFEAAINYSIGNLYSGVFAPKIENGNGKFQHLDKAQQQHVKLARFVADIHSGAAFANTGTVDIITGE
jgi:hypothetical protein